MVHGIAGRRSEYRPIGSRLTNSSAPVAIAAAFRANFGLTELYLADLDAIAGAPPSVELYGELQVHGHQLWVDAGVRTPADADILIQSGVQKVVAGLETLAGPTVLRQLCGSHGSDRIVFSLDLRDGRPLGDLAAWAGADAERIADEAVMMGVRSIILLDLARVGTSEGTGTEALLEQLSTTYTEVEWLVGGGLRGADDLRRLRTCGADGALIASALHDGRISRVDLDSVR